MGSKAMPREMWLSTVMFILFFLGAPHIPFLRDGIRLIGIYKSFENSALAWN